ncbi:hypothetical protein K469DRAFT_737472 [Zopfia rhizophila CBS 207.26]|uniref:Uncharacterized protein n=1 Tax=Zopfia rhizophila CBS 207.26 TaxID=1314779 RepID=A0A6A6ED64_9PEZI|nr:hypothetical protein K469DRAFT_737472 [Zopfia rhizophila CBS 207.26]
MKKTKHATVPQLCANCTCSSFPLILCQKKNTRSARRQRESVNKISESQTFEQELRDVASQRVADAPSESINAAPPSNAPLHPESDTEFDVQFADNFDGIDWQRLQDWIYRHGYRVCLRSNPERIYFICRYCHQHKIIDAGGQGKYEVTLSTSTAAAHLQSNRRGHNYTLSGQQKSHLAPGQKTLLDVGNAMGHFNVQAFRLGIVSWLVKNNHPLRELETPAFRAMIEEANPEALDALWKNH